MEPDSQLPIPTDGAITGSDTERTQHWQNLVEQWRQSELSQAEFVRQQHLVMSQFSYWKRKFERVRQPDRGAFVAVTGAATMSVRVHHPNGLIVECVPGTDVGWLRELMGM